MKLTPTTTLPEEERPFTLEGPDLVTAVREYGGKAQHSLSAKQTKFTVGSSPASDVVIHSRFVSSTHCLLERRGQRVRVYDQGSRNGTFLKGRQEQVFDIGPGDKFLVASSTLLALNEEMQLVRPILAHLLGYEFDVPVDDALIAAVNDRPLLAVVPKGGGDERLVQAIHQASLRRRRAPTLVPSIPPTREEQQLLIKAAYRGTLAVWVGDAPIDQTFLDMALAPEFDVRLIVIAPLGAAVESLAADTLTRLDRITVRPLRDRRADIGRLVDDVLVESRVSLQFADITAENQRALRTYDWPENFEQLRAAVAWIVEIVREGSIRKAAPSLSKPRTSLQWEIERLGLKRPLVRSGVSLEGGGRGRGPQDAR